MFIHTAVLRRNPQCAFRLVTKTLRSGTKRADWATGNIPVQPFPVTGAPVEVAAWPRQRSPRMESSFVMLAVPGRAPMMFELVLVERGGRWLVDYWMPAGGAALVPAAA